MSNPVNNMLNLIEDVKDNITSNQYKILLDNLMIIHNNNNNEIKQENNNNDGFINGIFWGDGNIINEDIENDSDSGDEEVVEFKQEMPELNFIVGQEYTAVLTDHKTNTHKEVLVKCLDTNDNRYYYFGNDEFKYRFHKNFCYCPLIKFNDDTYTGVLQNNYINSNNNKSIAVILKKNNDNNNNEIKQEVKQELYNTSFQVGNFYPLRKVEYYSKVVRFINIKCVKETATFLWFKYSDNQPLLKYRKNTDFYKKLNNTIILSKMKTKMFGKYNLGIRIFINKTDTQYNFNFNNPSNIGDEIILNP